MRIRTVGVYGKNAAGERVRMGWVSKYPREGGAYTGVATTAYNHAIFIDPQPTRAQAIAEVRSTWRGTHPGELRENDTPTAQRLSALRERTIAVMQGIERE